MLRRQPIRNIEKVQAFLKTVPRGGMKIAIIAVVEYIIGDDRHGLKHDDPYGQTTRQAVYGRSFESPEQQAYVMSRIKSGEIKTGQRQHVPTDASKGYGYKSTNDGYGATIENEKPSAYWSREWGGWKNWRSVIEVVNSNIKGAMRSATSKVNQYFREKGK